MLQDGHKFIVAQIGDNYRHFIAQGNQDHYIIARQHNIALIDIIEKGIILDGVVEVWECQDREHISHLRRVDRWLGNDIEDYIKQFEWWQKDRRTGGLSSPRQ